MTYTPTDLEYVVDALLNAHNSGLDLDDLVLAIEHAQSLEAFNRAVNMLALAELDQSK